MDRLRTAAQMRAGTGRVELGQRDLLV